jgi:hypothetical protein
MFALAGFAVGYVVGARAGREGLEQLMTAWRQIQKSEEFAALTETARSFLGMAIHQVIETGTGVVANEVKTRLRAA